MDDTVRIGEVKRICAFRVIETSSCRTTFLIHARIRFVEDLGEKKGNCAGIEG
jgi:hypothetical protein